MNKNFVLYIYRMMNEMRALLNERVECMWYLYSDKEIRVTPRKAGSLTKLLDKSQSKPWFFSFLFSQWMYPKCWFNKIEKRKNLTYGTTRKKNTERHTCTLHRSLCSVALLKISSLWKLTMLIDVKGIGV